MDFAGEVVRLTSDQLEEAEKMLGRAFFDNPMSVYILPDDAERARHLGGCSARRRSTATSSARSTRRRRK